jgi:catechol 2,3-dioxygenase
MTWIPAGEHPMTGERFRFTIPTGHAMELFAEKAIRRRSGWKLRLFIDVLGLALTEQIVAGPENLMIGAFLTCSTKPHDIAFIRQPVTGKFHHASFVPRQLG